MRIQIMEECDNGDPFAGISYNTPGKILFKYTAANEQYDSDIEIVDNSGCTIYIQEGIGFDYFLENYVDMEKITASGLYVVDGIIGTYYKGDGWTTDDDETWEYSEVRPASEMEIKTESLDD